MPAEGLDWMPRDEQLTDDELVRLITHRGRATSACTSCASPAASRCCAAVSSASSRPRRTSGRVPTSRSPPTASASPAAPSALAAAGVDRLNVSLDTLRADRFAAITRRDRLADVLAGLAAAARRGARPRQDQHRAAARRQRRRGRALLRVRRRPAASSCASSSRCRSTPQHGWHRAEMVTAGEIMETLARGVHAHARPDRARRRPGRALARRRRARRGRRHRLGHPAVLRRLRPHAAHVRRPDPLVPVRPHRDRPARAAARRGVRPGDRRHVARRHVGQARGPRHRRPRLPAAGPPDERDRGLGE